MTRKTQRITILPSSEVNRKAVNFWMHLYVDSSRVGFREIKRKDAKHWLTIKSR